MIIHIGLRGHTDLPHFCVRKFSDSPTSSLDYSFCSPANDKPELSSKNDLEKFVNRATLILLIFAIRDWKILVENLFGVSDFFVYFALTVSRCRHPLQWWAERCFKNHFRHSVIRQHCFFWFSSFDYSVDFFPPLPLPALPEQKITLDVHLHGNTGFSNFYHLPFFLFVSQYYFSIAS